MLLLNNGADMNAQQTDRTSPLHLAVMFQHPGFVRLLLDHGANVHTQGHGDFTAYTHAKYRPSREILQLLLEYGTKLE